MRFARRLDLVNFHIYLPVFSGTEKAMVGPVRATSNEAAIAIANIKWPFYAGHMEAVPA